MKYKCWLCNEKTEKPIQWLVFPKQNVFFCPECSQKLYKDGYLEFSQITINSSDTQEPQSHS